MREGNPTKARNPLFDVVKALMMLWVVWWHLGLYKVVESNVSIYMRNAKIGVNMPVFFVIGGYLAASTYAKADWAKLISRTVHFMWPQVAAAVFYALLMAAISGHGGGAFYWVIEAWFLHTYALVYLVSALIFRITHDDGKRWALFLLCYIAMLFWPNRFHLRWCGQVIHMFPYFVFGLMCLKKKALHLDWRVGCACGALYLATVFLQGDSNLNGMNFWKVNAHWRIVLLNWHEGLTFVARTMVGICGSVFVLFFVNVLIKAVPCFSMLSSLGMTTLGIYVMHEYPLFLFGRHMSIFPLPSWSRWLVAICWFLVCHCIVVLLKWWNVTRFAFLGDEVVLADIFRKVYGYTKSRKILHG